MNYDSQIDFILTIFLDMILADYDVICPSDLVRAAFHNLYLGIASGSSRDSSPKDCAQDFFIFSPIMHSHLKRVRVVYH